MRKIRIGNDIAVQWSLVAKGTGEPFVVEGKDIRLSLKSIFATTEIEDFTAQGNTIAWTFKGAEQKQTGIYSLVVSVVDAQGAMVTTDVCQFVELVGCSCEADGADEAGVQTESIDLVSNVEITSGTTNPSEVMLLIEELQKNKIDKEADDYYPQLSVGLADNLAGVDVVASEVSFRRSGGGAISDGVARIEAIKGNSVVWNQSATSQGEVIHMNAQSLESVGVNQWDEEWELGRYNPSSGQPTAEVGIRNKNKIRIIGGQKYYCNYQGNAFALFYDSQDNLIQKVSANNYLSIGNREFVAPINAVSMIFYVIDITTYNHDICINLSDASINGKYFPYVKRTQSLGVIGKYFPQGMKSAGTAHDEIRYDKATQKWEKVQRIGEVDMGSLNWRFLNESDGRWRFVVQFPLMKAFSSDEIANVLVSLFPTVIGWDLYQNIKEGVSVIGSEYLGIYDKRYEGFTSSDFKAAMAGVILYYELAEPIVTEIEGDFNLDYEVWNGGTEKIVSDAPTAPLKADISYGFNAVGKIKELEEKINSGGGGGVSKEYVDTKVTELSAEVSGLSERIDNLPSGESSVFEAKFGETTHEEIVAAVNEKKHIICFHKNRVYNLCNFQQGMDLLFTCAAAAIYTITLKITSSNWVESQYDYESAINKVTTINESSTNTKYPSAKAVYDFVSNTLGTIINGDY